MTIYLANGTKLALIARETAPAAAYKDMYHGNANLTHYGQCLNLIRNVKEVNMGMAFNKKDRQVHLLLVCRVLWLEPGS